MDGIRTIVVLQAVRASNLTGPAATSTPISRRLVDSTSRTFSDPPASPILVAAVAAAFQVVDAVAAVAADVVDYVAAAADADVVDAVADADYVVDAADVRVSNAVAAVASDVVDAIATDAADVVVDAVADAGDVVDAVVAAAADGVADVAAAAAAVVNTSFTAEEAALLPPPRHRDLEDSFEYVTQLGAGGFGEVWIIRSKSNGELVACKKVLKVTTARHLKYIQRELEAMRLLTRKTFANLLRVSHGSTEECLLIWNLLD